MASFYDYLKDEMESQHAIDFPRVLKAPTMDCGAHVCSSSSPSCSGESDEEAHPRKKKGEKGGGQFAKKPETLKREDDRDMLDKEEDREDPAVKMMKYQLDTDLTAYKKKAEQLQEGLGKLHGVNFTSLAKNMSLLRDNMRRTIKKLESLGYECAGDLEKGFTIKKGVPNPKGGSGIKVSSPGSGSHKCNGGYVKIGHCRFKVKFAPNLHPFSGSGIGSCHGHC